MVRSPATSQASRRSPSDVGLGGVGVGLPYPLILPLPAHRRQPELPRFRRGGVWRSLSL